jgi:ketosteroid isomerase-like protein
MTATAREVVEQLFRDMATRDIDVFLGRLADDVVFETPFPVPGTPARMDGLAAVREHVGARWAATSAIQVHALYPQVTETADPELVFVENDVELTGPSGVRERRRTSVNVVRVREGKVVLFRDYMSAGVVNELTAQG